MARVDSTMHNAKTIIKLYGNVIRRSINYQDALSSFKIEYPTKIMYLDLTNGPYWLSDALRTRLRCSRRTYGRMDKHSYRNCLAHLKNRPPIPYTHSWFFRCQIQSYCTHVMWQTLIQTRNDCTMGNMTSESTRGVLDHSLVCSHCSLIRLLRTARFARALHCAHSFARSLTRSRAHGKAVFVTEMNALISYSFNPLWDVLAFDL